VNLLSDEELRERIRTDPEARRAIAKAKRRAMVGQGITAEELPEFLAAFWKRLEEG
jgi:hypothetical protein